MKYFNKVEIVGNDMIVVEKEVPLIETKTSSGIVLSDGSINEKMDVNKRWKVHTLPNKYQGNMKVGDYIEMSGGVALQYHKDNEKGWGLAAAGAEKAAQNAFKLYAVRISAITCVYKES